MRFTFNNTKGKVYDTQSTSLEANIRLYLNPNMATEAQSLNELERQIYAEITATINNKTLEESTEEIKDHEDIKIHGLLMKTLKKMHFVPERDLNREEQKSSAPLQRAGAIRRRRE